MNVDSARNDSSLWSRSRIDCDMDVMQGFPTLFWPDIPPSISVDRWHPHRSWPKFKSATNVAGNQISNFCITSRKLVLHPLDLRLTPPRGAHTPVWNPWCNCKVYRLVRECMTLCVTLSGEDGHKALGHRQNKLSANSNGAFSFLFLHIIR